jgi:hypothetical protein
MDNKWSKLYPKGRYIFYEGDDPESFIKEIKDTLGFKIKIDWDGYKEFKSFGFHCPSKYMDKIYGGEYPVGS